MTPSPPFHLSFNLTSDGTTYSCSGRNGYWGGECWSNPGPSVASISVVTGTPNNETPLLSETVQGQWKSWRPFYLRDVLTESTQNTFTVDISSRDINNLEYDENCPLKDGNSDFQANTVQEWTLKDIDRHPFHLHLYHQQIANTQCGPGHDVGEYYDTVADAGSSGGWNKKRSLIKESRWGGSGSSSSECKVKFHSSDIGGRTIFHCHILRHEDNGAMGWVNFQNPLKTTPVEPCQQEGSSSLSCVGEENLPNSCGGHSSGGWKK